MADMIPEAERTSTVHLLLTAGAVEQRLGEPGAAEDCFVRALEEWRRIPGASPDLYGQLIDGLATVVGTRLEYAPVVDLFRGALQESVATFGPEHPQTTSFRSKLAGGLLLMGHYAEAETLFRDAERAIAKVAGPEDPSAGSALFGIAEAVVAARDTRRIDELITQALEYERLALSLPEDHPHRSGAPLLLGLLEMGRCNDVAAETYLRESIELRLPWVGTKDQRPIVAESMLAECLLGQGRFEEAEELLLRCNARLADFADALDPRGQRLQQNTGRLVVLYELTGRPQEADRWREQLIEPLQNLHLWQGLLAERRPSTELASPAATPE
jgi:tetratricopeptide (TPR) repeat protein